MGKIPADVVGQASSTAATATQNAATLTQSPQAHWYDVWSQTGSGLTEHATDPQYMATHLVPGIGVIDSRIRMAQALGRSWEWTDWNELKTGMSQQASAIADQASQLWNGTLPDGQSMTTLQRVGAAFGLLSSIEQLVTMPLGAIPFPAFPAIRIMDMDIGLPHAHMHPPNLTPPNPVPVPLPSTGPIIPIPFVSGASKTLINSLPAARCGDMGLGVWCGGYFPMYEVFLGSANVWIEGNRAGRVGVDITKHCIFSAPKPNDPPLGPMFGSTINCSTNVMIGGIPLPSLSSMAIGAAFKVLFKGVGKLLGAVRNAQKASTRWAAASARMQAAADNVLTHIPGGKKLKDLVNRAICVATGHPVDVASGQVFTDSLDVELPGPLPFKFERVWFSGSPYTGPLGHGWHHSFDLALYAFPDGVGVRLADGRTVAFAPPTAGRPSFNRAEKLFLHRTDRGYHVETLDGLVYHFGQPSRHGVELPLDHVRDANDNRIQLERERGRLTAFVDSGGRRLPVVTDSAGRITEIRVPDPDRPGDTYPMVSYQYDRHGDLVRVSDALGNPFRYEYLDHQMVRETDRNGLAFYFMYDGPGVDARCLRTWGDGNLFLRDLSYDTARRRTRVTNSLGHTTTYDWNAANLVVKETDPLGGITLTEWGPFNDRLSITNPDGGRIELAYDPFGRLLGVTDPVGSVVQYEYDSVGNHVKYTAPNGGVWTRAYDDRRNVVAVVDPLGGRREFKLNDRGRPVRITDPLGNSAVFDWTASGQLVASADRTGGRTVWEYDVLGRAVKRTNALGHSVRLKYDRRGFRTAFTNEAGDTATAKFDPAGNLVESTDPAGRTRTFRYVAMGRLAETRTPLGRGTRHTYDTEGQLTEVRDSVGRVWRFTLNAVGKLVEERTYDGRIFRYRYNAIGALAERQTAGGHVTRYERDANGRLLKRIRGDGLVDTFSYHADGNLAVVKNATAEVKFSYDPFGQVLEENVDGRPVRNRYDANGNRIERVSPLGHCVSFAYDAEGRLLAVEEGNIPLFRIRVDAIGQEIERTAGRSVWRWEYTPTGRMASVSTQGHATRNRRFEYNSAGVQTAETNSVSGRTEYVHNPDGYITGVRHAGGTGESYAYDSVGDIDLPAQVVVRRDADGQVFEKITPQARWKYEYDDLGQLTRASSVSGLDVRFDYDALGRRVRKTVGGQVTDFVWDGNLTLGEVGERTAEYLFRPDTFEPLAVLQQDQSAVIDCDPIGLPRAAWTTDGEIAWQAEFEPFGEVRNEAGTPGLVPFRYPGQYADGETGLFYNRFRYHDPEQKGYTTPDPLGLSGGGGVWAYVPNPLGWMDPYGLAVCPPAGYGTWKFNPKVDIDMRGKPGSNWQNFDAAINEAFDRTGVPRSQFEVTAWGKTPEGKTIPVVYEVTSGPNRGAQVNVDDPRIVPTTEGPRDPHVGYQQPGKRKSGGATRGHIILDDVPATRGPIQP